MTLADPPRNCHGQPDSDGHYPDAAGHWQAFPPSPLASDRQVDGDHYARYPVQVWDIVAMYGLDYFEGNVLKYLLRRKPGTDRITDLQKARHYLDQCIARAAAQNAPQEPF
jgi:Protein of unknwon function (DUF3310)